MAASRHFDYEDDALLDAALEEGGNDDSSAAASSTNQAMAWKHALGAGAACRLAVWADTVLMRARTIEKMEANRRSEMQRKLYNGINDSLKQSLRTLLAVDSEAVASLRSWCESWEPVPSAAWDIDERKYIESSRDASAALANIERKESDHSPGQSLTPLNYVHARSADRNESWLFVKGGKPPSSRKGTIGDPLVGYGSEYRIFARREHISPHVVPIGYKPRSFCHHANGWVVMDSLTQPERQAIDRIGTTQIIPFPSAIVDPDVNRMDGKDEFSGCRYSVSLESGPSSVFIKVQSLSTW